MRGRLGIPLTLLAGALIVLGIGWGAGTQKETFLGNQLDDDPALGSELVIVTGFLAGIGIGLLIGVMGNESGIRRITGGIVGGLAAWLLVFLLQASWPNYTVLPESGFATIHQSNLMLESISATTVLLPVICLIIFLLLGIGWAINHAKCLPKDEDNLELIHRDQLGVVALALPILALTAVGMIGVMLQIPGDMTGMGLVVFLHPVAAAGCMMLAVTVGLRAWHIGRLRRDAGLTWPTIESWRILDRIDIAGIAVLAFTAVFSTFLPKEAIQATSAGSTLVFTLRSHGQAVLFLAAVLVPLHFVHRRIGDRLPLARHDLQLQSRAGILTTAWLLILVGAGILAAAGVAFGTGRSLLPWVLALLPAALVAGIVARPRSSVPIRVIAAWSMWAIGNTIRAVYDASTFPDLTLAIHPGVSALWRMMAAILLGWVCFDVARDAARERRKAVVVPLALVVAFGTSVLLLLYLPLNVWAEATLPANKVAVGSLLKTQANGVQVVMHMLAAACGLGATTAMARLLRPEWFQRKGRAVSAPSSSIATV